MTGLIFFAILTVGLLAFAVLKMRPWHQHEFEIMSERALHNEADFRIATKFTLQCKTCGDLKFKKF